MGFRSTMSLSDLSTMSAGRALAAIDHVCCADVDELARVAGRPLRWQADRLAFCAWASSVLGGVVSIQRAQEDVLWPALRRADGPDVQLGALAADHRKLRIAAARVTELLGAATSRQAVAHHHLRLAAGARNLHMLLIGHLQDEAPVLLERFNALDASQRVVVLRELVDALRCPS